MGNSCEKCVLAQVTKITDYLKSSLYGSLLAVLVRKASSNNVSSLEGIISEQQSRNKMRIKSWIADITCPCLNGMLHEALCN